MRILLFSLLSFFCIPANAGWIKLNQNQAMDTAYFIDLENIRRGSERVRIWTLTDYTNIQVTKKLNYQSIKSFVEINCQSKKNEDLSLLTCMSSQWPEGKVVFSKGRPFEWEVVKPFNGEWAIPKR